MKFGDFILLWRSLSLVGSSLSIWRTVSAKCVIYFIISLARAFANVAGMVFIFLFFFLFFFCSVLFSSVLVVVIVDACYMYIVLFLYVYLVSSSLFAFVLYMYVYTSVCVFLSSHFVSVFYPQFRFYFNRKSVGLFLIIYFVYDFASVCVHDQIGHISLCDSAFFSFCFACCGVVLVLDEPSSFYFLFLALSVCLCVYYFIFMFKHSDVINAWQTQNLNDITPYFRFFCCFCSPRCLWRKMLGNQSEERLSVKAMHKIFNHFLFAAAACSA